MNIDMKNAAYLVARIGSVETSTFGPNNTKKIKLSVVQDDGHYKGDEWIKDEIWIDIEAFNGTAAYAEKFCEKGNWVGISGKLKQQVWVDRETGKNRKSHYLLASSIINLLRFSEKTENLSARKHMN